MNLREQVKRAIERSDLTRYRISKLTGVEQSQLVRLMRGRTGVGLDVLERIIEALGLEIVLQPKGTADRRKKRG